MSETSLNSTKLKRKYDVQVELISPGTLAAKFAQWPSDSSQEKQQVEAETEIQKASAVILEFTLDIDEALQGQWEKSTMNADEAR